MSGIEKLSIVTGFKMLMGLSNVRVENQPEMDQAIKWFESGLDFAAALHLASSMKADRFVTFDKAFLKKAKRLVSLDVVLP